MLSIDLSYLRQEVMSLRSLMRRAGTRLGAAAQVFLRHSLPGPPDSRLAARPCFLALLAAGQFRWP